PDAPAGAPNDNILRAVEGPALPDRQRAVAGNPDLQRSAVDRDAAARNRQEAFAGSAVADPHATTYGPGAAGIDVGLAHGGDAEPDVIAAQRPAIPDLDPAIRDQHIVRLGRPLHGRIAAGNEECGNAGA